MDSLNISNNYKILGILLKEVYATGSMLSCLSMCLFDKLLRTN